VHHLFQGGALAAQVLGAFGVIPDVGLFQFAGYFDQAFVLGVVVKDTPSGTEFALEGLQSGCTGD
jgi:hypothetical protein